MYICRNCGAECHHETEVDIGYFCHIECRESFTGKKHEVKMIWRVRFSRALNNVLGGKSDQMLSSRLHVDKHWMRHIVNFIFLSRKHCEKAHRWERMTKRKNKKGAP